MMTISKEKYLEAAQLFHWASREHYVLWFTGKQQRHGRTEVMLKRLVDKGKLTTYKLGRKLVYAVPRINRNRANGLDYAPYVEHGLGCTEGLIRFWISKHDGVVIPERHFRGGNIVPEWGIVYPTGLLLYEFCTLSNFLKSGNVASKIKRYKERLEELELKYGAKPIIVFVIDAARKVIESYLRRHQSGPEFYFCDYETFKSVPIGGQFGAPIYISGVDGVSYPLTKNA